MWRGVRCTHKRFAPNSRILARARRARRNRAFFLSIMSALLTSSSLLYDAHTHLSNAHPCLCRALVGGMRGFLQRPDQATAYRLTSARFQSDLVFLQSHLVAGYEPRDVRNQESRLSPTPEPGQDNRRR